MRTSIVLAVFTMVTSCFGSLWGLTHPAGNGTSNNESQSSTLANASSSGSLLSYTQNSTELPSNAVTPSASSTGDTDIVSLTVKVTRVVTVSPCAEPTDTSVVSLTVKVTRVVTVTPTVKATRVVTVTPPAKVTRIVTITPDSQLPLSNLTSHKRARFLTSNPEAAKDDRMSPETKLGMIVGFIAGFVLIAREIYGIFTRT
ncbi:hypothetical protein P280DRAFT_550203 [Massarina eburnea CBS 473.64]|uniref:Uncharacterized protein n=1 Tax=Massarina eburnea CBS 473.64 TaxID=1395130 RepID=A0A6A6RYD4_9PLEO|nr:hypothetical protein P280DRAFT_550203 [Massarina eburnea CBS 473.64]